MKKLQFVRKKARNLYDEPWDLYEKARNLQDKPGIYMKKTWDVQEKARNLQEIASGIYQKKNQ